METQTPTQPLLALVSALANVSTKLSKATLETEYGLILELGPANSVVARLRGDVVVAPSQKPSNELGYKYYINPEFGADSFGFASSKEDYEWPGNPEDERDDILTPEDILKHHSKDINHSAFKTWTDVYEEWRKIFDKELKKEIEEHDPIPQDETERRAWPYQGLLIALWLALLPSTASVHYDPNEGEVLLDRKATGEASLGNSLARYLEELNLRIYPRVDDAQVQG